MPAIGDQKAYFTEYWMITISRLIWATSGLAHTHFSLINIVHRFSPLLLQCSVGLCMNNWNGILGSVEIHTAVTLQCHCCISFILMATKGRRPFESDCNRNRLYIKINECFFVSASDEADSNGANGNLINKHMICMFKKNK